MPPVRKPSSYCQCIKSNAQSDSTMDCLENLFDKSFVCWFFCHSVLLWSDIILCVKQSYFEFLGGFQSLPKLIYSTLTTELIRQELHHIFTTFHETQENSFSCKQRVEIKQKQLLFVWLSGENLQINLPVFPLPFQLGLVCSFSCLCLSVPHDSVSVFTPHSYSVCTLHSALHDVYNKQQESVSSVCVSGKWP